MKSILCRDDYFMALKLRQQYQLAINYFPPHYEYVPAKMLEETCQQET